jgi:hypothetical membrane protein
MMAFSLGVWEYTNDSLRGKTGSGSLFLAAFFLLGIGVFPETIKPNHFIFSVAFFVTLPIAMLILSSYMIKKEIKNLGYLSIAGGIIAAFVWTFKWDGVAIPEAISAFMAAIMSISLGYRMMKIREPRLTN